MSNTRTFAACFVLAVLHAFASSAQTSIVAFKDTWKYLDNGTNQGTAWRSTSFNDATWKAGVGKFGYGISDAATVISYGANAKKKYITTYFRKSISIADVSAYSSFTANVKRDDGVVVFVNGTEVYRNSLPTGTISYTTLAAEAKDNGSVSQPFTISTAAFTNGTNVIAVEIHQQKISTPDMAFDLELAGNIKTQPPADQTPPTVQSINRYAPATENTTATSVTYRVTFSEEVSGVDATDFTPATLSGSVSGSNLSLARVSASVYDVLVGSISGAGVLGLYLNSSNTGIADVAGNAINGGFTTGEIYTIEQQLPINEYTLTVNNSGSGTIAKNPDQATYSSGSAVSHTATPASGFTFSGWSGDATGASNPLTVTMNSNKIITATFTQVQQQAAKLINSGGTQFTDGQGRIWLADVNYSGGSASSKTFDVIGTTDDGLYLSYRKASSSAPFSYNIPLEAGTYTIKLHFMEPYFGAPGGVSGRVGGRVFHVDLEGQRVLTNYDIYAQDGAAKAIVKTFGVSVTDGTLNILFTSMVDNAIVSAIEAEKTGTTNTTYSLTVNTTGNGTVIKTPNQATYPAGTTVTLTANPASGYYFSNWSGDVTGTANPLTFMMNSDKTITGNFAVVSISPATLTRGPYLQMISTTAMTLRWRTDIATDSKLEVGTTYGNYTQAAFDETATTEHEVRISGLNPDTKYFYRFGSSAQVLQTGTDNFFLTAPEANVTRKIRVAAFGDCGRAGSVQTNVLNAYRNFVSSNPAELMLLLGDNAYVDGTDSEYQSEFFTPYSSTVLKNHALFPTPGNHDYHTTTRIARDAPYYKNFSLPITAECGGIASGTEAYYSFNWGNIHFISLDSHGEENPDSTRLYDTLGPQVTWVKKDLEANNSKWTIVYWHHPPFSKGSHNSDTEGELIRIRENFIRILERYGVDLVLCGHSHDYERSYLLNGYYGTESNFDPNVHTASTSSGKYNGSSNSCPYTIPDGKIKHGTVYVVSGSAARSGSTIQAGYPHDALPFATNDGGMFYFEVEDNRLDAKFIRQDGVIYDQFTLMKGTNKTSSLTINSGASTTLMASWIGTYYWSTGATTRSITVSPTSTTIYTVTDNNNCLEDVFNINIFTTLATTESRYKPSEVDKSTGNIRFFPSLVKRGRTITLSTNNTEMIHADIVDIHGRLIQTLKFRGTALIQTANLAKGMYYIVLREHKQTKTKKFIVTE